MRSMVKLTLTALLVLGADPVTAQTGQNGTITGQVVEARTQRPLPDAQVHIPGTGIGTLTNNSGRYILVNVPAGPATVRVQMIGYGTTEQAVTVAAGETGTVNFELAAEALALDEVVVTGTAGGARQREVGFSISRVDAQQMREAPAPSIEGALQGRAAGLTILQNSGQPGAGGTIRLRGNNSVTQGNEPLFYVDGVRIHTGYGPTTGGSMQAVSPLGDIKPSEIDRIEVIRGPAATTLYGTEASGGVIQIFTKRGAEGPARWEAEVSGGINNIGHVGPRSDPTGLTFNKCRGPELVDGLGQPFTDVTCPESGSWLRNGPIQRYNLSVQGGLPTVRYALSGYYSDEQGVLPTGYSSDGGFRANYSFRPVPALDVAFTHSYSRRTTRWVPEGNRSYSFILNVARGPYNQFKIGGDVANGLILDQEAYDRTQHFVSGLTITHDPSPRFNHRLSAGYDYNQVLATYEAPLGFLRWPTGYLEHRDWFHGTFSLDYVSNFRTSFGNASSVTSWGGQLFQDTDRLTAMLIQDFAAPGIIPTLTTGARRDIQDDRRLRVINAGVFAQQMLGYRDLLFLTGGLRVDGNSAFGQDFGLQPYPKLSASYVLSEHGFWPRDLIESFKLRAAVGDAGKAPGAFDATQSWQPISVEGGQPGFTPAQLGNPNLGPERTREYEVGFDASALAGRLTIEATAYHQRTTDALVPVLPIPSLGFNNPQLENLGELQNRGIEALLNVGLVSNPTVDWSVRLNASRLQSKAVDLGGEDILINAEGRTWVREGYPVPAFFGDRITNPNATEAPIVARDEYLGSVYANKQAGIGTTLTLFNNLTLDALLEYQGGGHNLNATGWLNARRFIWQPCYDVQDRLRQATANPGALDGVTALERARCAVDVREGSSDWWIESTDFMKLRHVSLTYNLPERWVPRARSASVSLAGRNLWTLTDYTGLDPEITDSGFLFWRREYYNMPPYRVFLATLRVRF